MRDLVFEQLSSALVDKYLPLRALGHGAMASVYLSVDIKHQRRVAIKALRLAVEDGVARTRFLREIRYLAQLQHPHIVPLFDSGDADGIPYYVTSYVEGDTLRQQLATAPQRRLAITDAMRCVAEVADALDYAHMRNILHRDIKPENILIHAGHALVADFGIARAIQLAGEASLSDTGVAVGTPAYMSPEQLAADRQLDARSDVFALGCVAYEMLAGAPPFMGVRGVVDNARKFTETPASVAGVRPDVAAWHDEALRRALASDPADRFGTAGEFAAAMAGR